jgi:diacylglycerol kinase (ATP)
MRYSRATILVNPALTARPFMRIQDLIRRKLRRLAPHVHIPDTWHWEGTPFKLGVGPSGKELVVVVGGDGTINRAVNCVLKSNQRPAADIVLGIVPAGTACSLPRELGIPRGLSAIRLLSEGSVRAIDLLSLHWLTPGGEQRNRLVTTLAHFGFGGAVVNFLSRRLKKLGGFLGFGSAATRELLRYKAQEIAVELDGVQVARSPLLSVIVANSRCEGGGMCVAPAAQPDDGLLDTIAIRDLPMFSRLISFPTVYAGRHIRLRAVSSFRGKTVVVAANSPLSFEFDGEPAECLECHIEVVPSALQVIVPHGSAPAGDSWAARYWGGKSRWVLRSLRKSGCR